MLRETSIIQGFPEQKTQRQSTNSTRNSILEKKLKSYLLLVLIVDVGHTGLLIRKYK